AAGHARAVSVRAAEPGCARARGCGGAVVGRVVRGLQAAASAPVGATRVADPVRLGHARRLPRATQALVRMELRQAQRALRRELFEQLPREAELERIGLRPLSETGLDFYGMQLQARKAAELPDAAIVGLLDRHATELELPDARRLEIREQVLQRKASLVADFDALVESLRHERDDNRGVASTPRSAMVRVIAHTQDAWQRFAIVVLHTHVVRPLLRGYRSVLGALARAGRRPR